MPGGLNGRVARLENGRAAPCSECGFSEASGYSNVEIKVVWDDLDGDETHAGEAEGARWSKWCGTCGHQLEYVVTWQDLPDEREEQEHDD